MSGDLNVDPSMGFTNRSFSLTGPLSGNGDLIVARTGNTNAVFALGGDNSAWNGNLIVASGNGRLGGTNGTNVPGNGAIYIGDTGKTNLAILSSYYATNGGVIALNSTITVTNKLTVRSGGSRSLQFAGDVRYNYTGNIELQQTLNINSGLNYYTDKWIVLAGNISGNGGGLDITRSSLGGYIELSGNNTYAGTTTISNGATLRVNSSSGNGIPDTSSVSMNGPSQTNGASVFTNSLRILTSETIGSLSAPSADAYLVIGSDATLTTGGDNSSTTYAGNSAGPGGLTKEGSGTMTLSGVNTYTGLTRVIGGTLVVSNASFVTTIDSNSTTVNFAIPPGVGTTNNVLSGPLDSASLANPIVTGLSTNTVGILTNNPNLQVIVTSAYSRPTFASTYPVGSENIVGPNGLPNLMSYALGGTGTGSSPALPVLTFDGTTLTLTANIRNDGEGVGVVGQYAYSLDGPWNDVVLNGTGTTSTVPNTTLKAFSQNIEPGQPRKFLRFKATLTP
jgi:autotransporter-associated beta strand protein